MKKPFLIIIFLVSNLVSIAQTLNLTPYLVNPIGGKEFTSNLASANVALNIREQIIYQEIVKGNIPDYLMKLSKISHTEIIDGKAYTIAFYVTPDYLSIGNDSDNVYIPMTPILAQKVATKFNCSLPTKKMVDLIYNSATIKLEPKPIPPSDLMTTIFVLKQHDEMVKEQLKPFLDDHQKSELTAGNKKDVIISNKIYTEATPKVVIYGWHKLDGKPIQPVYNKHANTWADYSHGIRLLQNNVWVNGKKTTIAKVLADQKLAVLLSDEGVIKKAYYPITDY
ncbi:MAG: hypothetical protein EOP00_17445 [Pedobacter sp.]|nr:MAG: hypothetical protein EOP00_17445 [Pedobacter sp.]